MRGGSRRRTHEYDDLGSESGARLEAHGHGAAVQSPGKARFDGLCTDAEAHVDAIRTQVRLEGLHRPQGA